MTAAPETLPLGRRAAACASLIAATALLGCDDVGSYSTTAGESYCGAITLARNFRQGLGPRVHMRLALDATRIDAQGSPGRVWAWEPSSAAVPGRTLLDGVALEPFAPIANDVLGDLELGEGRDRNAIYGLRPGTGEGMIAVLSLRSDGRVEVRLLRAGLGGDDPPEDSSQVYGIFLLERRKGDCGYETP